MTTLLQTIRGLFAEALRCAREYRRIWIVLIFVVAGGCFLLFPYDVGWNHAIIDQRPTSWMRLAHGFSRWGDYPTGTLIIVAALWLTGAVSRRPRWKTVAVATLLAASVAGIETNAIRWTTGRPRPAANQPDGFYGPSRQWSNQSFPSAHTTTAFATAAALAVAVPPVGLPLLLGAAGVGWSRLYLNCHYPTDVWAGAGIGILNGILFGWAALRLLSKTNQTSKSPTPQSSSLPTPSP